MLEQFANNATTTLGAAITSTSATTLVVSGASGFPTSGNFRIAIDSEILLVTGVSGTTFTVTRGVEGTTAATHSNGAAVSLVLTAAALANISQGQVKGLVSSSALIDAAQTFGAT